MKPNPPKFGRPRKVFRSPATPAKNLDPSILSFPYFRLAALPLVHKKILAKNTLIRLDTDFDIEQIQNIEPNELEAHRAKYTLFQISLCWQEANVCLSLIVIYLSHCHLLLKRLASDRRRIFRNEC